MQDLIEIKEKALAMVGEVSMIEIIEYLQNAIDVKDPRSNYIISLVSKYHRIEQLVEKKLISKDGAIVNYNRVNSSLVSFIAELDKPFVDKEVAIRKRKEAIQIAKKHRDQMIQMILILQAFILLGIMLLSILMSK